jgi:hypothetical protein
VLNEGLDLAMAFGENWLRPIQSRLAARFPQLEKAELDAYDAACRKAMKFGHEQAAGTTTEAGGDQSEHFRLFEAAVLAKYAWVTPENLSRLFSQGCYYARK